MLPCFPTATVVTPGASEKQSHAVPLPTAAESPRGCPGQRPQSQPDTDFPCCAPGRSRKHPKPCIAHREAGAGLQLRTTYLSASNVSTQVIYGLPFSMICHWLNDLQARGASSPRGLYPAGREQDGETLHWEVYCSFSWGKVLECKGHCRALACSSKKISRIQLPPRPPPLLRREKQGSGINSKLWGKPGWKSFIQC